MQGHDKILASSVCLFKCFMRPQYIFMCNNENFPASQNTAKTSGTITFFQNTSTLFIQSSRDSAIGKTHPQVCLHTFHCIQYHHGTDFLALSLGGLTLKLVAHLFRVSLPYV